MKRTAATIDVNRLCALFALGALLCGCGTSEPPQREVMPVKDTVFAPALGTIDKARGVQDTLEQGKLQTDATLKNAEQ